MHWNGKNVQILQGAFKITLHMNVKVCCSSIIPSIDGYFKSPDALEYHLQILQIDGAYSSSMLCNLTFWNGSHKTHSSFLLVQPVCLSKWHTNSHKIGNYFQSEDRLHFNHKSVILVIANKFVDSVLFSYVETVIFFSFLLWIVKKKPKDVLMMSASIINWHCCFAMMRAFILPSSWTKNCMLTTSADSFFTKNFSFSSTDKIEYSFHFTGCCCFQWQLKLSVHHG